MKLVVAIVLISFTAIFAIVFFTKKERSKIDKEMVQKTRSPAVAGQFYPSDKSELENTIKTYLSQSEKIPDLKFKILKSLIVPHAGYSYSGSVAATGFAQVNPETKRVILLGASHQSYFEGAAIDESNFWQTPLGKVKVDKNLAEKLISPENKINFSSEPHTKEHSLEVQLPFLQTTLKDFNIVPILLGNADDKTINGLSDSIYKNLDENTILIISTDLSHYPSYEDAKVVDQKTIEAVLTCNPEIFEKTIREQVSAGYNNLATCACADKAVKTAMIVAQKLTGHWELIKYANSGDTAGDKSQVVGYVSMGFIIRQQAISGKGLSDSQKQLLLKIARETLAAKLAGKPLPKYEISDPQLNENLGVFVTLNKHDQLRGCIGEFEPETPLWQTVAEKVIDSALNDPRFPSVTFSELKDIEIEISVLSKPERIDNWKKIELGKHGVIVRHGTQGGTFLPQVATETGWSLEEFLGQLCSQKAGLPSNCYKDKETQIFTYTAEVFGEKN